MVLPLKLYMGNASGSQSFTLKPTSRDTDAAAIGAAVQMLVAHGSDTTWVLGEASEVEDGADYNGDATSDVIFNEVQLWLQ
jgi:hypothetical protein